MVAALLFGVYALAITLGGLIVWRHPLWSIYAFLVGLAVHNAVLAALYSAGGLHGRWLTGVQAWKEVLMAVALTRVGYDSLRWRRLPYRPASVDWLALAFAVLCGIYALLPQDALGGLASANTVALALRHNLLPVAAFLLYRALDASQAELRRISWVAIASAAFVAAVGLLDVYLISIEWWRTNGVIEYFHDQLGYDYHGTGHNPAVAGLPENFIYNTGSEEEFLRRLVSTFLSPLGSAYLITTALLIAPYRNRLAIGLAATAFAGLLFTFSRSSLLALAVGLVVWALVRRRIVPALTAVAVLAVSVGWAAAFPHVGPVGHWTKADLVYQRQHPAQTGVGSGNALSPKESSVSSHWTSLKEGAETVFDHPQGYGLGNAGQTAARTGTPIKAGESNYTELGAEMGVLGTLLFVAWSLAILVRLWRASAARMAAAFAAVLVLAVQTDVFGDPWIAFSIWGLAGLVLSSQCSDLGTARSDRCPAREPV
jgi:O-antigen ligase/polysaccharide polymerase Wzy-like membrane protein